MSDTGNPIHSDSIPAKTSVDGRAPSTPDRQTRFESMEIASPTLYGETDKDSGLDVIEDKEGESNAFVGEIPDMYAWENIGLYCQYAAVGLLYGSSSTLNSFCVYTKGGEPNVCANASNIVFFAWNFKVLFAIVTDVYRPFNMHRKPWMIFGWTCTLVLLLVLACAADQLSVEGWLVTLMFSQFFMMFSDVPADGYSVQLGKMEPPEERGQILATGQRIRFTACICASLIQTLLLNGPTTNPPDAPKGISGCWGWGMNINEYYGLIFAITAILVIPILWLQEVHAKDPKTGLELDTEAPTWSYFLEKLWMIVQNQTTLYLLVYVIFFQAFGVVTSIANFYLQYYVIQLSNFQSGIDNLTSYMALVGGIYLFQTYLIHRNWRITQWASAYMAIGLGLLWIPAYHNSGGTMNAWYTIFIDLDKSFVLGISQVLYSMSVIELSRPGIEATTYELVITVGNACLAVNTIVGTQLLIPAQAVACEVPPCPSDSVDITSRSAYYASNGPEKFTNYTLILTAINVVNTAIWVNFLPSSKEECGVWKKQGEKYGDRRSIGIANITMCSMMVLYGFIVAILLLDPSTSCEQAVGGDGC